MKKKKEEIEVLDFNNKVIKKKKSKWVITFIIFDVFAFVFLFFSYGPIPYFRNLLVTTAMTTAKHKYFAYILYSQNTINKVLNNNYVLEVKENTDSSKIIFKEPKKTGEYESIYEEQILKKDKDNNLYKYFEIDGPTYKGYIVVIYDASKITLAMANDSKIGTKTLNKIVSDNGAILGINASGHVDYGNQRIPMGAVIKDSKILYGNDAKDSRLIGFNKENILILTNESPKNAVKNGMRDGMEFGPFLIVNGKNSEIKGNGGWGIANRTAIAQRKDGIVLFLVVDGRTATNPGATMKDLIKIFNKYGAYNAANLDGGGSSTLVIGEKTINDPKGYNYSGERYLTNAWILK